MALNRLTQRAQAVFVELYKVAGLESSKMSQDSMSDANILAKDVYSVLGNSGGVAEKVIQADLSIKFTKSTKINLEQLFKDSYFQAIKLHQPYVGTEHILLATLKIANSKSYNHVKGEIMKVTNFPGVIRPADNESKTPMLMLYGNNATIQSFISDEDYIYRKELDQVISTLLLKENPNPLIIGDFGVGKESLVNLLIKRINDLEVPPRLLGYQVMDFDLVQFVAGVFNKGVGVEQSMGMLIEEIRDLGRVILHVRNFQNIFVPTNSGIAVPFVYSLFKSGLNSAGIKVIATMETELYDRVASENPTILGNFSVVEVSEPSYKETIKVMNSRAEQLSEFHNIKIGKKVIEYAYEKSKDVDTETKFPQKGLDVLDKACTQLISKESKVPERYRSLIDETFVIASKIDDALETGDYYKALEHRKELEKIEEKLTADEQKMFLGRKVPLTNKHIDLALEISEKVDETPTEIDEFKDLDSRIKSKIIGQDKAVDVVVKSLIRSKLGLRSKNRPVGNFLFLGPTGVGKTELAKVLADEGFGEDSLIRLDMSDFGEKHTVARLVGAPPGYVGYGEGGELTQKIELKPQSVVLFDEIEKAHPDVLNILLQIMEEGELSDARGQTFSFSEAIIILTSNMGTEILHKGEIGFDKELKSDDKVESRLLENLKRILKPELINRFDEVVVFKRLSKANQMKVLNLLIKEVKKSLKEQNIKLTIDSSAKNYLLEKGYSNEYGARALRRTLEKELLDKIAEVVLDSNRKDGEMLLLQALTKGSGKNIELVVQYA